MGRPLRVGAILGLDPGAVRPSGHGSGPPGPDARMGPTGPGEATEGVHMAAMKPRTGDGPLEVTKEGRGYVMRVPLEGGGRLVVELNGEEAKDLGAKLLELFA